MTSHVRPGHTPAPIPDVPAPVPYARGESSAGSRIVRNAVALGLARPLTWASAIGLTILLPRYLGDANLGKINFAFAFADWCGLIASFGIATYLTKEVARRRGMAGSIVLNALLLRLALALSIGIFTALLVSLLGFDRLTTTLIYLFTIHMLLMVIGGVLIGALQGMEQLRIVALVDSVSKVLQLGLIALALVRGHGVIGVAIAYIVADVFTIIWYLHAVRRHAGFKGPVSLRDWRALFFGGLPFLIWETALLTYARTDVIILSLFAHDAVLGWYAAAYRIISIPLIVPGILMTVLFPALSATARNRDSFDTLARRGVQIAVLTTLPMALGLMILADKVIDFLDYPEGFTNSVIPLAILAASLPLVGMNMIVGSVLNAQDRQRQWAIAGILAAVLNVTLNMGAIPYTQDRFGNGAIGAAAVTSLTEVFLLAAGQYLMPKRVLDTATYVGLLKCVVVGLIMTAVVWFARDLPLIVAMILGAATYAAGSLSLGTVSIGDVLRVRRYLTDRRSVSEVRAAASSSQI